MALADAGEGEIVDGPCQPVTVAALSAADIRRQASICLRSISGDVSGLSGAAIMRRLYAGRRYNHGARFIRCP